MEEENVQLIELKQIPVIEERLRAVKDEIEERTQTAVALVCTEETYKDVKKARADLKKQFDELEDQRKAIKNQILEPYNRFEEIYKECVADPFKKADASLKGKIDEVEGGLKKSKEEQAKAYFAEICQLAGIDWLTWERTGIKVNLTTSLSKLKAQAVQYVDQVRENVAMIDTMNYRDEILVEYRQCMDVAVAVSRVTSRKKAIEEQAAREAERRAKAAEAEARAQQVRAEAERQRQIDAAAAPAKVCTDPEDRGHLVEGNAAPAPKPKIYHVRFDAYGTLEQMRRLKTFLESEGIRYESRT